MQNLLIPLKQLFLIWDQNACQFRFIFISLVSKFPLWFPQVFHILQKNKMNLGKSEEAAPYLFRVYLAVFPRILSPCKYCIFTFITSQCNIPFSAPSPFYPSFINLGKTWVNITPWLSRNAQKTRKQGFPKFSKIWENLGIWLQAWERPELRLRYR